MQVSLRAIALASFLLSFCVPAAAQVAHGSIELTITDPSGGAVPGARVAAENPATGLKRTAESNQFGIARLTLLPPGVYRVRVEVGGFKPFEITLDVKPGTTAQQAIVLEVGQVAETVTVTSSAPMLQIESSTVGPGRWRGTYTSQPVNTESYARIEESGFQRVKNRPLSTFSSDVDTASYANVRRFLKDGSLPPSDAVRIEELLNYFRYDDAAPEGEHPIAISAEVAACPWQPEHKLARIALRTKPIAVADLPPASLTFLIDVSGSMALPDKLPLLKEALAMLVEQLRPEDSVAIVVYAGAAGVVLEPTRGSRKRAILSAIERLEAGGSTAGAAGIRMAYELARASFRKGGGNRVILATDGDFNVGVSTEAELVRLIEKERESGVFLTVLGFGTGNLQDSKMEQLADHGNGQYLYIDTALEARRALVEQLGGTLVTVAKDVKIQVEFNPERVHRYRLIGYENRLLADEDFRNDKKDAGDLGAGHSVVALYEIDPERGQSDVDALRYQRQPETPRQAPRSEELLYVKVRYKAPEENRSVQLDVPVLDADPDVDGASEDMRWTAAVAQFGMLLRDSDHSGEANWESTASLARGAMGQDEGGARAEFLHLIRTAAKLEGTARTSALR